ncbi:hypothetical protein V1512DRAFT_264804 [Lipomyces arxii]|uniref:uncharacterized protein n=1 Tax=Lipomyces arxii TaxID=56418 RepID=UPI0034CFF72F
MSLPDIIPYTVCLIAGTLVTVYGYGNWSWEIIVLICYALVGLQVAAIPTIDFTCAID